METTTPEILSPITPPPAKRNTFLTVICILSFIGSGWGIISSIRTYFTADAAAAMAGGILQHAQDQMDQQNTPDFAKKIVGSVSDMLTPENIRKSAMFEFISNLLTLCGALLMFNLRKIGFFLYIAGILVLIAHQFMMGGSIIGAFGAVVVGFFGVGFIVMYGVNLKTMTK